MKVTLMLALIALVARITHACTDGEVTKCFEQLKNRVEAAMNNPTFQTQPPQEDERIATQCRDLEELQSCLKGVTTKCPSTKRTTTFELALPYTC